MTLVTSNQYIDVCAFLFYEKRIQIILKQAFVRKVDEITIEHFVHVQLNAYTHDEY